MSNSYQHHVWIEKTKNQEVLLNYKKTKNSDFDFDRIALFLNNTDKSDYHQIITEDTLKDMDFDELFMFVDRTISRVGQQYYTSCFELSPGIANALCWQIHSAEVRSPADALRTE